MSERCVTLISLIKNEGELWLVSVSLAIANQKRVGFRGETLQQSYQTVDLCLRRISTIYIQNKAKVLY